MITRSDVFLFVLDGRGPDDGAAVELGIAHTHRGIEGRPVRLVGLMTDARAAFLRSRLNPMLRVPLSFVARTEEKLLAYLNALAPRLGDRQTV